MSPLTLSKRRTAVAFRWSSPEYIGKRRVPTLDAMEVPWLEKSQVETGIICLRL